MKITLDKFRAKLVIKILHAASANETERFIKAAIQAMQKRKINGYLIIRFIDKVFNQLGRFHAASTDPFRWSNITIARYALSRHRDLISEPAILKNKLVYQ